MTKRERDDDNPSIDALEAAARRDREEAEELLAGFDRPGRRPRRARGADFVSHYRRGAKGEAAEPEIPPAPLSSARRVDPPTVVIPRKRPLPAWVLWASIAALMVLFGGLVAFVATSDDRPPRGAADGASPTPSALTTLTGAHRLPARADEIPPPDASEPEGEALSAGAPSPTISPRAAPTASARLEPPTTPRKSTQRDDFIRDL